MPNHHEEADPGANQAMEANPALRALIEKVEAHCPFGPVFFLTQLRGFVRDNCPDAAETLPMVELLLHSGESLRVCHVIGVAPRYVILAVYDDGASDASRVMRTEFVPYELITRVTIRTTQSAGSSFGFNRAHTPVIVPQQPAMTPEEALRAAAEGWSPTAENSGKRRHEA